MARVWQQRPEQLEVLMVVRNLTNLNRLLDVTPMFHGLHHVRVRATVDPGSRYAGTVDRDLADHGMEVMPWRAATHTRFSLVLAAHAHRHLAAFRKGNVIVLPHGAGYNRLLKSRTGSAMAPVGLSPKELLDRWGRVIPRVIGLSSREQLERLSRICPEALSRALVIGDPGFDRILASRALRRRYRRLFGVGRDQTLVFVTSTWGENSLLRTRPDLMDQLLAQLPADRYRVVLVQHVNTWVGDTPFAVRCRLSHAMEGGLVVLPPTAEWSTGLIAGDVLIGDHGSATFYGAAAGLPTLLTDRGAHELDPASPLAEFVATAERFNPYGDLRGQIDRVMAEHRADRYAGVTERMLGTARGYLDVLRPKVFELLGLSAPDTGLAPRAVSDPRPLPVELSRAYEVSSELDGRGDVVVERFPAVVGLPSFRPDQDDRFLMIEHDEFDMRLRESAEIVINPELADPTEILAWTRRALHQFPGAFMVAAGHGEEVLVRLRDNSLLHALITRRERAGPHVATMAAAAARALVLGGRCRENCLDTRVRMGPYELDMTVRSPFR